MIRQTYNNFLIPLLIKWKEEAIVFFCYLLLPFLFYLKSPLSKTILGKEDACFLSLPFKFVFARSILNGEFPFWNPYNLCGTPFFADMEVGMLYPLNWLFFLLTPEIALNLNIMLHYTLSGVGTFLYLKHLDLKKYSAFFGGLAFMFCGFMLAHKEHVNLFQAAAWLPFVMLTFEKLAACKKLNFNLIGIGALVFALQILAGHPQIPVLTGVLVFWRLVFQCTFKRQNVMPLVVSLFIIITVSTALCGIQILPTYNYQKLTIRSHLPYRLFADISFSPLSFILLLFPFFFGSHQGRLYHEVFWGSKMDVLNLTEYTSYPGFAVYILFAIAFCYCLRRKIVAFYLFMVFFALFMMLGGHNPFYKIIYHTPILNLFRAPSRYVLLFNFAVAVCASFGLNYLLDSDPKTKQSKKRNVGVALLFSLMILFFLIVFYSKTLPYRFFSLLIPDPRYLPVFKTYADSLTISNPAIFIPLLFMILSLLFFCLPLVLKKVGMFRANLWGFFLILLLFADLFFVGNYLVQKNADISIIHQRNNLPLLQKAKNDTQYRTLFESPDNLEYRQKVAALTPNLNMIHKLKMATAENYSFVSDTTRRMLDLDINGSNRDCVGLLNNNKIISAFAIKYILLSTKSPAYLAADFLFDGDHPVPVPKVFPDLTLQSKDGSWSGKAHPLSLDALSIYEISFDATGKVTAPLFLSIFSHELERNILLTGIHPFYDTWKPYKKIFVNRQSLQNCELHLYSKSSTPISLKHIKISKLYSANMTMAAERQKVYKKMAADEKTGMALFENKNALPIVYCVNEVKQLNSFEDFYKKASIIPNRWDPAKTAYIESPDLPEWKLGPGRCSATISSQGLNYMEINTISPDNHFLVYGDSYLPGWKAWIDGKETIIYKTNGILKGVYVPKGSHKVVFRYQTPGFYPGLIITIAGSIVLLLLFLAHYLQMRKRRPFTES